MRFFSSSILPAALTVTELSNKPFVRKALQSPNSPSSILSFFFGVDYNSSKEYKEMMREGIPLTTMNSIWFSPPNQQYDTMCQQFIPVIRSVVGTNDEHNTKEEQGVDKEYQFAVWNSSVDGIMSQVLLCDQLSRNCFRGSNEAFRYDSFGERHVKKLVHQFISQENNEKQDSTTTTTTNDHQVISGELYPPYCSFLITALMHSENMDNLNLATVVIEESMVRFHDKKIVVDFLKYQEQFLADHREVVNRFGRYPHRNSKLGRTNTPEEQQWLDDVDNLPGWAKSQG